MFSYLVCRACYVNLPPTVCRVDDPHVALIHIRGQTTLLACNRLCLPCLEFLGFTNDREIVL
jgi:hypothetical protein